jgi:hypothetical protein
VREVRQLQRHLDAARSFAISRSHSMISVSRVDRFTRAASSSRLSSGELEPRQHLVERIARHLGSTRTSPRNEPNAGPEAREGRFDVVVAEALDRLSREQAGVASPFKLLLFHRVAIVTRAEGRSASSTSVSRER